ncbi:methyltransferase family protein [Paludibacter jiangxiensis]|uniref:Protein-S-isoprenylcysteine O-methyltransferase Ste14 n=1 Tax=Paludibacter jiangxiensis TaxID=681398 RepID=A0A161LEU1_9BACT|nr:isoprenylcysteine carboxylmethyltransferase family protein [Paludibacter jiangxiensis]GAT62907.1 protein-S-isoprenylcysteine O-methyltransferase Ste14 [Paludibacter jiangxiensis]
MENFVVFILLSLPVLAISRRSLFKIRSHGFYRFFAWESMAFLLSINYPYWFYNPFGILQIISWILLFGAIYPVAGGIVMLKKRGKPQKSRQDDSYYKFEETTELVESGIYKYIRHPMYCSLLLLTWGIFLKNPLTDALLASLTASIFLFFTSVFDEKECLSFFGEKYRDYMKRTKRFIPYIF